MQEEVKPKMYQYLELLYNKMDEESEDGRWTGSTSGLFGVLQIPLPYYGHIVGALKEMGSIVQVQRGGGPSPSIWAIGPAPTLEQYRTIKDSVQGRIRANSTKAVEQRLSDIEQRLHGLDLAKVLSDLQEQVDELKAGA